MNSYHNPYLYLFFVALIATLGITLVILIICLFSSSARIYSMFYLPTDFTEDWTQQFIMLSSIYCQLLVVVCVVLLTAEVVTGKQPLLFFSESFFLYLYSASLLFLVYVYFYLLRHGSGEAKQTEKRSTGVKVKQRISENDKSHGSLFLRVGAIAFGLGTMIYSGLEFGLYFEIPTTSKCYSNLLAINPILQMIFTFAQMYFIFMNARLNIQKFKVVARFGLMHIVATNICVWARTLGKETLQEVLSNQTPEARNRSTTIEDAVLTFRARANSTEICERVDIMGSIVVDASPYLYPFIIEYSLISAAVLYVMWRNIGKDPVFHSPQPTDDQVSRTSSSTQNYTRGISVSHASHTLTCAGSSKGLFLGLFVLVCSTICLIVFFVLVQHNRHKIVAIYMSESSHCGIQILTILAILIGFFRVRKLKFHPSRNEHLRSILLSVSSFGLYVYSVFGIVAGALLPKSHAPNLLLLLTSILTIVQVTLQSLFIADITCRTTYLPEHDRTKPGRQAVAFLLIANMTLWIVYTFEMQKVEASPVQLGFYGFLAWTFIIRSCLPLSIFYRFHSSVTLAEVWKNSYRDVIH
ncbi:proton channel OtopLc [Galendromus occidentalis]|uniref:Proton channel OtopLc n=1 Tax=Galendromus occidentalis TaxID=34638 RepID=A0AAJ7SE58_9ACAR|nr:proton channel OtopLc [Galendromus occidentalis]